MKKLYIVLLLVLLNYFAFSQTPEWMIIDLQQLIWYEASKSSFNIDLESEEILEISFGEHGQVWFATQNYRIKMLLNNFVIYPHFDLQQPLLFLSNYSFGRNYFSRITETEIVDKYPENSWIKYEHPDTYEYAIWLKDEDKRKKYVTSYELNNYSVPLSFDQELSFEKLSSNYLNKYPSLLFEPISIVKTKQFIDELFINIYDKLSKPKAIPSCLITDHILDIEKDVFGNLWIATGKRLFRFNGSKFFVEDIPAVTLESDDCNLWIGTAAYNSVGSLIKFDGEKFTYYNYLNSPLPDNAGILDIKKDDAGNLWIALKRKGIPGKLENNLVAVFNEEGIMLQPDIIGLTSVSLMVHYVTVGDLKLLASVVDISYSIAEINPSSLVEIIIDDSLIFSEKIERFVDRNTEKSFQSIIPAERKYDLKFYLTDSLNSKNLLNHLFIDSRINEFGFFLGQNEPNPFSTFTKIEYIFYDGSYVEVNIFDVYGRLIDYYRERPREILARPLIFNSGNNPNGIYFYHLKEKYQGIVDVKKMILFDPEKVITLPH